MELKTLEDWKRTGGEEMHLRLTTADAPTSFAVCRHYASWMRMFRLFLLSHDAADATNQLGFLEAVDELKVWAPHAGIAWKVYDLYVSGEKDAGRRKLHMPSPIRDALTGAFGASHPPDRAEVFEALYQEVVRRINDGCYGEFKELASGLRTAWNAEEDHDPIADEDMGADRERMARRCRKAPAGPLPVAV
jgi:hypothetical protein